MSQQKIDTSHNEPKGWSPFLSGKNFEYRVMQVLKQRGYYCFRSHASQGPFDIAAIAPTSAADLRPLLIQAKKHAYIHPIELERLLQVGGRLAARVMFVSKAKNGDLIFVEYPAGRSVELRQGQS